jgi:hypothetical protein
MKLRKEKRLGLDFGRVINDSGTTDTSFLQGDDDEAMRTPAMAGVYEVLPRLVDRFGGRVWIVSKCGEKIQRRTLQWLTHNHFYRRTGVAETNVRFCRQRPEKAVHCAELGITHFVDDRVDVHRALEGVVPHRYLFGPQQTRPPRGLCHTPTWFDLERAILTGCR